MIQMVKNDIQQMLTQAFPQAHIVLDIQGSHCYITVVSATFVDKSKLQRQQMIHRVLGSMIAEGQVHALHLQTYTPHEWEQVDG